MFANVLSDKVEALDIFPENWGPVQLFMAMLTQWRVSAGMGGTRLIGLDYQALPVVEQRLGVPRRERADYFACLQSMERAYITAATPAESS